MGIREAPGYHPNDHVTTTSFVKLVREDGRRRLINMNEGLSRHAQLNRHVAESNFLAIENLYGKDRAEAYLRDKEALHSIIKYEEQATAKQMEEYVKDLKQHPVTDRDIVTVLLHPSTKAEAEDRSDDQVQLQRQSKPTAAQVVANTLKQWKELEKKQDENIPTKESDSKADSQKSDGSYIRRGKKRTPSPGRRRRMEERSRSPRPRSPRSPRRGDKNRKQDFRKGRSPKAARGTTAARIGASRANPRAARIAAPSSTR